MISINELIMSTEIGLIFGLVALGIFMTFRIIDFPDLTCDGSIVLGAVTSSTLLTKGYSPITALIIAFIAGSIAGSITGFLNLKLKITNLLSGILTAFMLYSINLKIMGGIPNITLMTTPPTLMSLLCTTFIITIILGYILNTDFGLAIRSIGQNQRLGSLMGVNITAFTLVGLMLSNGLIALGGGLFAQYQGFADINSGLGALIMGLASIIIGERLLPFRSLRIKVFACVAGSIVYRILINIALHSDVIGLKTQDLNLITGILVIGIMVISKRRTSC